MTTEAFEKNDTMKMIARCDIAKFFVNNPKAYNDFMNVLEAFRDTSADERGLEFMAMSAFVLGQIYGKREERAK